MIRGCYLFFLRLLMSINPLSSHSLASYTLSPGAQPPYSENARLDSVAQIQADYAQFRARLTALGASQDEISHASEPRQATRPAQMHQPRATPAMRVPSPVYMNPVPNLVVQGALQTYVVDNSQVHLMHNRRADARYEAAMEMAGPAPTGRAAMWWSNEIMPYTTDIARTGISEAELKQFSDKIDQINIEGHTRVFSWFNLVITVMICGATICCEGKDSYQTHKWSPEHRGYKMGVYCQELNENLHARGIRASFRANYVSGMGYKLELHNLG